MSRLNPIFAAIVLIGAHSLAGAQVNPLSTTAGLKAACERNVGNVVRITTDMAVNQGARAFAPERVNTGCRIELVGDSEIQFDKVGLAFAGPLVITGGSKTGVAMQEASLAGTSVSLTLSGDEGYLRTLASRIDATAGGLSVSMGRIGKMELLGNITAGVPLTNATLAATGGVTVSAGDKMSASFNEVGIVAGTDVRFTGTGSETELKLDNSAILSFRGNVAVALLNTKSKLEGSNSSITARVGSVDMALGQPESGMNLSNVAVTSGGRTQIYAAGSKSEVGISNGTVSAGGGVFISAAAGSSDGSLKVEGVGITATTPVRLVTGAQGKTIANNNRVTATGSVDFSSDPLTGLCEAVGNRITAPTQRICQ